MHKLSGNLHRFLCKMTARPGKKLVMTNSRKEGRAHYRAQIEKESF